MTRLTHALARIRAVPVLAVALTLAGTESSAQIPDFTQPPPILNSAGQFSARRLSRPPVIDGQEWIASEVETTSSPGRVPVPTQAFSLTLADCGDHAGDFVRCRLLFQRGRATPVPIDAGFTGWAFVTPDARYIVTEPLFVLDVREWKQYALFEALQIPNYTNIEAISRDGKRLFISRKDCAIDCRNVQIEYFELILP
jgi:hypothetical protein